MFLSLHSLLDVADGCVPQRRAFDAEDDALTPRPTSRAGSLLSVGIPPAEPLEELDLTLTVGREWDRQTTSASECSTSSSMFFSARSCVESTRRSV